MRYIEMYRMSAFRSHQKLLCATLHVLRQAGYVASA